MGTMPFPPEVQQRRDSERYGSVAAILAARLIGYQRNRIALFAWMDRGWLPDSLRKLADDVAAAGESTSRLAHAWLATAGCPPPALDMFRDDEARLAALPIEDALSAMCLRALHFRRAELRYWIDRDSRAQVAAWLGERGFAALRWLNEAGNPPAIDRLMRDHGMAPLDELDMSSLAWEGFCLFDHAGLCEPPSPLGLLRFAWHRDARPPAWLAACDAARQRDDGMAVIAHLPDFYQEHTWSSG
ncbi:type III secretion protein HrpB4 [Burkholderia ambifaria]|nr:type III secretion protein HrpB4 [Burkholderia ambifaria]